MAATAKANTPAALTTSAATYYTVSASVVGNIKEVLLCNTSGSAARSVTVYFVPSGGSPAASNTVISGVSIASSTTVRFPFNTFLAAADTVQALASAGTDVSIRVSAVEFS